MAGVLEHFDHEAFELIGFSYGPQKADPVRERIVRQLDQCFEVGHLDDCVADPPGQFGNLVVRALQEILEQTQLE